MEERSRIYFENLIQYINWSISGDWTINKEVVLI